MGIKLELTKKVAGKYSQEDLTPHDTVAAIISKGTGEDCEYLILYHKKHQMLTCPIGKVKSDQSIDEGLKAECKEEVDIKVENFMEVLNYSKTYNFAGKKVPIKTHVFKIVKYSGTLKNNEPKKHKWMKWMTRKELEESDTKLADSLTFYFAWLDDKNTPSLVRPNVKVGDWKD